MNARILVNRIKYVFKDQEVITYSKIFSDLLQDLGHEVTVTGWGSQPIPEDVSKYDFLIDLDSGRTPKGNLQFVGKKLPIISAVWYVDSHGHPTEHKRSAKNYDHVFFCVWAKRDLFIKHPSAHWCPNATDYTYFNSMDKSPKPKFDFGFFGSKKGLDRADPMKAICEKRGWSYDIRQVSHQDRHRWPYLARAMGDCKVLFNSGQKHDGPNLRVMESMNMGIPLITDKDPLSGMDQIFDPNLHYIPYEAYTYKGLEESMEWAINNPEKAMVIARNAQWKVQTEHQVVNRLNQIMSIICK